MGKKIKSAYESALERLGLSDDRKKQELTEEQKKKLGELDRLYEAKVAEQKILAEGEITQLIRGRKFDEIDKVKQKLVKTLGELEERKKREKERVRSKKGEPPGE